MKLGATTCAEGPKCMPFGLERIHVPTLQLAKPYIWLAELPLTWVNIELLFDGKYILNDACDPILKSEKVIAVAISVARTVIVAVA